MTGKLGVMGIWVWDWDWDYDWRAVIRNIWNKPLDTKIWNPILILNI
ncbi:hypothetical protein [Desulfosporosinus sp. FKA]|nr:hypothetical protein [Desulfosporosinus sp. FKA]